MARHSCEAKFSSFCTSLYTHRSLDRFIGDTFTRDIVHILARLRDIQGSRYLLCQRLCACFVLKTALQRGDGQKKEGVQNFITNHTEPLIS